MSNQIHFPFNAWGYHDSEIDKHIKRLFVIDRGSSLPLYFRHLPGNMIDVSSLNVTVEELRKIGVKSSFAFIDAGFFSDDNITRLFVEKIDFLTRLPSNRTLHSELVEQKMPDIESFKNAIDRGESYIYQTKKSKSIWE